MSTSIRRLVCKASADQTVSLLVGYTRVVNVYIGVASCPSLFNFSLPYWTYLPALNPTVTHVLVSYDCKCQALLLIIDVIH